MMLRRFSVVLALLLGSMLLAPSLLHAQLPRRISYQGLLTTPAGTPVADGNYSISALIFDAPAGGLNSWSESFPSVPVHNGTFHLILGANTPLALSFNAPYYLEITVDAGPSIISSVTLSPRTELSASPYALRADSANGASPVGAAGGDLAGSYPAPSIAGSAVNSAKVLDGSLQAIDIANSQIVKSLNGKRDHIFLKGSGGATVTAVGDTLVITATGGGGTGIQGVQNTNSTLDIVNPNGPTATLNVKVPLTLYSVTTSGTTLSVTNDGSAGTGIIGSGPANGVSGISDGSGVTGLSLAGTGVFGQTYGVGQSAVLGINGGDGFGVTGNTSVGMAGVFGTGVRNGVYGFTTSINDAGLYGRNDGGGSGIYGSSGGGRGVWGVSSSSDGVAGSSGGGTASGVFGENTAAGFGVKGTTISGIGVYGVSTAGRGVWGASTSSEGVRGSSTSGVGVYGSSTSGLAGYFAGKVEVNSLLGDDAVKLPDRAVNSVEMSNEPGIVRTLDKVVNDLVSGIQDLDTCVMNVPANGYILALGSVHLDMKHFSGTTTKGSISITDVAGTQNGDAYGSVFLPASNNDTQLGLQVFVQGVFPVTAGLKTLYLTGKADSYDDAGGYIRTWDEHLVLIYIPTAYGAIAGPGAEGMTEPGVPSGENAGPPPGVDGAVDGFPNSGTAPVGLSDADLQSELTLLKEQLRQLEEKMSLRRPEGE